MTQGFSQPCIAYERRDFFELVSVQLATIENCDWQQQQPQSYYKMNAILALNKKGI